MLVGNHTLFICLICVPKYFALACSFVEGSKISHTQGVGIGLTSVGPSLGTVVDSAIGIPIPIDQGRVFM